MCHPGDRTIPASAAMMGFRQAVYSQFLRPADALMEILDALLCLSPAMAPAHLMLLPGFQRRWGSIYDALAAGRVNRTRIEDLLAQYPLESGEAVYACDTSTWVKNDAETSPRRGSSSLSLRNSWTGLVCWSAGSFLEWR